MRAGNKRAILMAGLSLAVLALGGCSGERSLKCGSDGDYLEARTAGQLRIPDDLSVPDEADSLRIPAPPPPIDESGEEEEPQNQTCLEQSPAYSKG